MPRVYVAAGSNVRAEENLARAVAELAREFPGARFSPWYRNRAVGFTGDDFINLVAGFDTALPLAEVVTRLQAIEALCGRGRDAPRWAPRSMDLDVLLYGDLVCDEPHLKVPRPDLLKRAYMLGPLAALAPEAVHPTAHASIGELWRDFDQAAHPLERLPH
ncbi:MAG TPA: 2-amino-4-hydroxy-6-hydroxymethyldihydropteridine diphosphokinase [Steroidobacteraceae bacterium]|nr:2-amino-4-hydroxy-6-hydroxymethyldihydropteridine diphosphokinase [Steroidobacteraceae bacterium]